jgi:hypothetical protein
LDEDVAGAKQNSADSTNIAALETDLEDCQMQNKLEESEKDTDNSEESERKEKR